MLVDAAYLSLLPRLTRLLGLDDLCVRFIVNLPKEELESVERICFQVEEAQWFYEDFIRPLDPNLPSLNLRQFCLRIFQHCPLLSGFSPYHHSTAFSEFLAYKTRVPVRGAIMLNQAMDEVVLVKGWKKGANWSFPRGKINKDEKDLDCAVREVYEETGFDIQAAGLVGKAEDVKYIEVTMREQHMRLYVFRDVPMNTHFEPRTRKEISKIQWYKLSELPTLKKSKQQPQEGRGQDLAVNANKFYMVAPFLVPLKRWISQQKKQNGGNHILESKQAKSHNLEAAILKEPPATIAVTNAPPVDDLSRLLANLRQSSQKPPASNLPELPNPVQAARDASIQLKSLLRVPIKSSTPSHSSGNLDTSEGARTGVFNYQTRSKDTENTIQASTTPSYSLIDGTMSHNHLRPDSQLPRTPFTQVMGPPPMPASPHHHVSRLEQISKLFTPPSFLYSPDQVGKIDTKPQVKSTMTRTSPTLDSCQPESAYHPQDGYIHSTHSYPTSSTVYPSTQSISEAPAPYQRTGDPDFAQAPRYPNDHPPSIPPASNLPLPKLTTHSSALLEIFRSNSVVKPSSTSKMTGLRAPLFESEQTSDHPQVSATPSNLSRQPRGEANPIKQGYQYPSSQSPSYPALQAEELSKMRFQQQEALLNLFRTSAGTGSESIQKPSSTLEPPATPIELSAFPSPSHSRATSQIDHHIITTPFKPMINGKVVIKRQPVSTTNTKNAPVSATVTGPLNVPQFDRIVRRSSSKTVASSTSKPEGAQGQQTAPVTILSRPLPMQKPAPIIESTVSSPASAKAQASYRTPAIPPVKTTLDEKTPLKTFQPQILRRPAQVQPDFQASSTPTSPAKIIKKDDLIVGPRLNQAQEHRDTLLSLFSKPSPAISPLTPSNTTFASPMLEKPSRFETVVSLPHDTPKSRIGSIHSIVGNGNIKHNGAIQPPKQTPVDKTILLSYLDGVVKEGRK